MNLNEEIKQYMEQINNLGFGKILNLNSKQTAGILGVSASSIEKKKKKGIGISYIEGGGRILYPKLEIAKFQATRKIKTL